MYAPLPTRNDQGLRGVACPNPIRGLGGITGADAFRAAKAAESNLNPRDYESNPNFAEGTVGAEIENSSWIGFWSNPGGPCAGRAAPKLNLFTTAGGLAVGTTGAGIGIMAATHTIAAATAGIATAAVAGVGAIIGLVSVILAHHAAAVRQEQDIYCQTLPGAANAFEIIKQAVDSGQQTPQQGIDALDELLAQFESAIAPSYGHDPYCNAMCEQKLFLDAVVRYWKAKWAEMPAVASVGGSAVAQPGAAMSTTEKVAIGAAVAVFAWWAFA